MSIGRRAAAGQFTVIMGIIHFMNEYFICNYCVNLAIRILSLPDLLAVFFLLPFQCGTGCVVVAEPRRVLAAAWPGAISQAGHVGAVASAVEQGYVAVARPGLGLAARAASCLRMPRQVLAMAFATGAQAPLHQRQSRAQAMARDDLVAVGGAAVVSRQHAVGAAKSLPGR